MDREQSPLRGGSRLTLELFDYYVARARAERAKAIAEFGGHIVAWLSRIARRLARHRRPARSRDILAARSTARRPVS